MVSTRSFRLQILAVGKQTSCLLRENPPEILVLNKSIRIWVYLEN